MRPLRYLYVLALIVWLGGIATAAFIVAPTTFGVLQAWNASTGRVLAGDVFGAVLDRLAVVAYAATATMFLVLTVQRLLGPRPKHYAVRVALLGVVFGLTFYTARVITPRIDGLQAQVAGPMSDLPAADARRTEFDRLHGLSTTLLGITMLAGFVLAAWETRE